MVGRGPPNLHSGRPRRCSWCLAGLGSAAALDEEPERRGAAVGRGRAAAHSARLPAVRRPPARPTNAR